MAMKTSVVVADGTFATNTAPLLGSIEEVIRQAGEIGYDAVSITVNRPEEVDVEAIQAACAKCGVAVSGLATGRIYGADGFSLGSSDDANRQEALRRMLGHAELCAKLGARLIVGSVRGMTRDAASPEEHGRLLRESMAVLVKRAEELGIVVLLEAISHIDCDSCCTIAETADFVRSFHSPALRLQIDSMHLHYSETDFYSEILKNGDLLGQVDISDLDRMAPDGEHFDFPKLMQALKEVNYDGYLLCEFRAEQPDNAAKVGYDYVKSLI